MKCWTWLLNFNMVSIQSMSKSKKNKKSEYVSTITGYHKKVYRIGKGYVEQHLSLYPIRIYWSFWYKNDSIKLKVTKLPPHNKVDSYGWECRMVLEVVSIVELDKPKTIIIK